MSAFGLIFLEEGAETRVQWFIKEVLSGEMGGGTGVQGERGEEVKQKREFPGGLTSTCLSLSLLFLGARGLGPCSWILALGWEWWG